MEQEIKITAEGPELILRTGGAANIYDPAQVILSGTIEAPGDYAVNRKGEFKPLEAHVIANVTQRTIVLRTNESDKFGSSITGKLGLSPYLTPLGINENKMFSHEQLFKQLRFMAPYFHDRDTHAKLLSQLKEFNGKLNQEFKSADDLKGNTAKERITRLQTNLDLQFLLSMPIFAGGDVAQFMVEICVDADTGAVRFWLESTELHEQIITGTELIFETELERLKDFVIVKQY